MNTTAMLRTVSLLTCLFLAVTVLAAVLVGLVLRWTLLKHILDVPNHRSLHASPTPRGGGVAIVLLSLGGWWCYAYFSGTVPLGMVNAYTAAAALVALVSWIDDLHRLSRSVRFAVHLGGAILLLAAIGWPWQSLRLPLLGTVAFGAAGTFLAVLWIVGLTNIYNFMDGIDGIAGGQALSAGLAWSILGLLGGAPAFAILGLLLAASSAGFLFWNRPPARIFMGDVGSAFLGFTFAAMGVMATQNNHRLAVAGVLVVWPFVFDSGITILRRLVKGENVLKAHCSHLYQRLVRSGWTHGQVSLLYTCLAAAGIVPAILFVQRPGLGAWATLTLLPVLAGGLWLMVIRRERHYSCLSLNSVSWQPEREK